MSFPRHWTRTHSDESGAPMEYAHNISSLRVKNVGGKRSWRIVNKRGMFARSWLGRMLTFATPDAAAARAEQVDAFPPDFAHGAKVTSAQRSAS